MSRQFDDILLGSIELFCSTAELHEPFRMRVLSLEVLHDMAFAKVHVPALGFNYFNYLSLLRKGGCWRIISKVFIDVPSEFIGTMTSP